MLTKVVSSEAAAAAARLTQVISYRDEHKAIEHLCGTYGFHQHQIVSDPDGAFQYAHLTLGSGTIMIVPAQAAGDDRMFVQPDEIGGAETQACYFTVADIERHYERAQILGAEIMSPLQEMGYGGVGYTSRDPEGHIWSFGNYDPRRATNDVPSEQHDASGDTAGAQLNPFDDASPVESGNLSAASSAMKAEVDDGQTNNDETTDDETTGRRHRSSALIVISMLVASVLAFTVYVNLWKPESGRGQPQVAGAQTRTLVDAKSTMRRLEESVVRERHLKEAAMSKALLLEGKLRDAETARAEDETAASRFAESLRQHITNLEGAVTVAEQSATEARAQLEVERSTREEAVAVAEELLRQLALANDARTRAEVTIDEMRTRLQRLETAMAESTTSTSTVSAELDQLKLAKQVALVEAESMQQALSDQRQAQEDSSRQMDVAMTDLRRQLGEEQKAREAAEEAAAELRSQIKVAELTKAEATREIVKIELRSSSGVKVGSGARRAQGSNAKRKSVGVAKPVAEANAKPGQPPQYLKAAAAKKKTTYVDWDTQISAATSAPAVKARGRKKDFEVWEYTSPLWQENAGN